MAVQDPGLFGGNVTATELDNGITLIFDKSSTPSAVLDVSVGFGAAYEQAELQGIAHFLEHSLFNGSKKYSKQEIFYRIDECGGEINAFTLKQSTRFFVHLLKKDFSKALDIFSDCFKQPLFEKKMIEIERKVIFSELARSIDDPEDFLYDVFLKDALPIEFGRRTLGNMRTIKRISREDLIDVWKENYYPKNLVIGVSGNFKKKDVMKQITNAFSWNLGAKRHRKTFSRPKIKHSERCFERKIEQAQVCIGFPVMNATDVSDFLSFKLINISLGGGLSSRLNRELREKRGLCYSINTVLQAEEDYGFFLISSATKKEKLEEMKSIVLRELQKLKDGEISKIELQKVKSYLKGNELILRENLFKRTEQNIQCWQYFKRSPQECFDLIDALSLDDIRKVAEKYIQTENYVLTTLLPK